MIGFHRDLNRATADNWDSFAPHRRRVTDLLLAAGAGAGADATMAVLGAGNCNDLLLEEIAPRYAAVHLLDIDREAIKEARARQPAELAARLVLHAPVDLGGALAEVGRFRGRRARPDELGGLPGAGAHGALVAVPQRFEVVASTCLLSQLVHGCQRLLGDRHPQIQEIACAVVIAHLRIATQLVKPGGRGIIVTDVVSSDTYPLDEIWGQRDAWAIVDDLETTGNHLSGTTPKFLRRVINTDPVIAPLVGGTSLESPWLWRLSDAETYLVYALGFTRRA